MNTEEERTRRRASLRSLIARICPRPLVLVDIENLTVGGENRSIVEERVTELNELLPAAAMVRVAARPAVAANVWFAPGTERWRRLPPRRGKDGSDRALIESLTEPCPADCDSLVIASGDHAFIEAIDLTGLPTVVLSVRCSASRRLARRATQIAYLESFHSLPFDLPTGRTRRCTAAVARRVDITERSDLLDLRDGASPYGLAEQKAA